MDNRDKPPEKPADVHTGERPELREQDVAAEHHASPEGSPPQAERTAEGPVAEGERGEQPRASDGQRIEERRAQNGSPSTEGMEPAGLLPYHEADGYRRRWEQIQGSFVDDPKQCCEQADALVIEVLQRMSVIQEEHRGRLRGALDQGGDTEGLRQAMQQYRAFFSGLLSA